MNRQHEFIKELADRLNLKVETNIEAVSGICFAYALHGTFVIAGETKRGVQYFWNSNACYNFLLARKEQLKCQQ